MPCLLAGLFDGNIFNIYLHFCPTCLNLGKGGFQRCLIFGIQRQQVVGCAARCGSRGDVCTRPGE